MFKVRIGIDIIQPNEEKNKPLTSNQYCGSVNGKTARSVCCHMIGRFVTIQAITTETAPLEIGKITIKVAAPSCTETEENENLCGLLDQHGVYDENQFNDDRNDGSCIPTTTTTTTTSTTTSTTTQCDPTPLSGDIGGLEIGDLFYTQRAPRTQIMYFLFPKNKTSFMILQSPF